MNLLAHAHTFFIISGILLIAIALIQMLGRPRGKDGRRAIFRLDATTMRALLFVSFGVLTLLVGAGVISMTPGR
jgi:uncharacterized membrane protein YfcA